MTVIVDTAPIVAASDRRDPRSREAQRALSSTAEPLVISPFTAAEVDYLLHDRVGGDSPDLFLRDLADGTYRVECLLPYEYRLVRDLSRRYAALAPGLADLSLVALAARFDTTRLLTFDERHFRAIEPIQGGSFTLLPIDL